MQKKVFIIILPIAFFIFYGCSSMKHSTIVLYVSHKVEGPLYMPQQEPPVSAQAPQTNTVNQSSQERRPARGSQATQNNSQTNQNSQSTLAQASQSSSRPARGSQATQNNSQTNQNSQSTPAQASQSSSRPARGSQATQNNNSQTNQNSQSTPAQASQSSSRPARGSQATQNNSQTNQNSQSTPAQASQSSSRPARGSQATQESQTNQSGQPAPTSRRPSRGSQTQAIQVVTNTYRNGYQTRTLPRGEFLILENPIRFAFEKYGIDSSYDGSVQYVANYMKENTNFQLVVEGHTDRVGEYDYNSSLSLRRSRSAISKLVRAGVERNRLIPSGVSYRFSEYNFNRLNRRVEFIIIRNPEELTNYREAIK